MRNFLLALLLTTGTLLTAQTTRLKVMHYNLLSFGPPCTGVSVVNKYGWLGTILNHYRPDILTVNEIGPELAYGAGILSVSFSYTSQMAVAGFTNVANADRVNNLFYNKAVLGFVSNTAITGNIRDINVYKLYLKSGLTPGDTTFLYCIVAHLKAGNTGSDENARDLAADDIMAWLRTQGKGQNVLVMGDMNIYGAYEPAYQAFVSDPDTLVRLYDPTGLQNGWSGNVHARHHTQSTRLSATDCGSSGGMDDRFDMILLSRTLDRALDRLSLVPDTYAALGNDGSSYNTQLNCNNNPTVPSNVCGLLRQMSDHLPVVLELEVSTANALESLPEATLRLPNQPFGAYLTLDLSPAPSMSAPWTVAVYTLNGALLYRGLLPSGIHSLPTAHWARGLYLIRVSSTGGQSLSRMIQKE
ncbi:MAG: hypothetical protein SF053_17685 [Bacteroidia bacterium]|nr:hypothetical protein [Bacteroidia bacterium]